VSTVTAPTPLGERLDLWLAADPAGLADPYALFEEIRAAGRVVHHKGMAFLTGYDDVKAVSRGDRRFSRQAMSRGSRALEHRARLDADHQRMFDEVSEIQERFISRTDGEPHERLRGIAHRAFTPRKIAALEEAIQRFVDELIAAELARDASEQDLMNVAYGLPLWAICHMLGAPESDREMIHAWSLDIGANHGSADAARLAAAHAAHRKFDVYVHEIIERHKHRPGSAGELVSALLDAEQGDRLTEEELSAMFVVLLFAGHETTTNLLGGGLRELLRRPDVWDELAADRSLLPNAIEEVLRYVTPVQYLFRYALEDASVGDDVIPAGSTVFPLLPAANRDPAVFSHPDVLDIRRAEAKNHLALGFGPYFCLGASLARLEATTMFRTLLDRYPRMTLVDDDPGYTGSAMLRRLSELRVVLAP
jgi:cytochrome P450